MIGKLLDLIVGREPVAAATGLAGGVVATIGILSAFNVWRPTPEQVAAIGALVAWVAGYLARRVAWAPASVAALDDQGKVPGGSS